MLYNDKEVANISNLYGLIQYSTNEFYNPNNDGHKKNVAEDLLNLIPRYYDEIPFPIRKILDEENNFQINKLKGLCIKFLESKP